MDVVQTIKELINGLGFPVAMVVYFIWDKTHQSKETMDILNKMSETLAVIKSYIENNGGN